MNNNILTIGFLAFSAFFFSKCKTLPPQAVSYSSYSSIETFDGPEDIDIDSSSTSPRLIISCDERRVAQSSGKILSYDFSTQQTQELFLKFPKDSIPFHPHGISVYKNTIFIISHSYPKQSVVLKGQLSQDSIIITDIIKDKVIHFPNDIYATSENDFYITHYKYFTGKLVAYNAGRFTVIDKHLNAPNGVIKIGNQIIISTTLSGKIISYDIAKNYKKQSLFKIKGGDNLYGTADQLLVSSHPKFNRFLKHYRDRDNLSPSVIYELNLDNKSKKVIYSNEGQQISAASGAIFYKNKLYIAQVFENFVLICNP
ncbi:MAG: hypothetical protein N4A35_13760 [Flavobacteriales bacterium]|jgi:hypothetical protein|nr:hypothetical protein [Flavobacteriales bacterium]